MDINKDLFTKEKYTAESGDYTKERKELHCEIIRFFIDQVEKEDKENKQVDAILLGGGSNSGKSTIVEELPDNMVIIDSDEIKKKIPIAF